MIYDYIVIGSGFGGTEILPETKAEKIFFNDNLNHIETIPVTSFFKRKRKMFKAKGVIVAAGALGTLELLLKQKYKDVTLPSLSDKLGFELRTNAETLCAVSGASEKLNNGLVITSVFSPDPHTHVEIVKYPDNSNAMKMIWKKTLFGGKMKIDNSGHKRVPAYIKVGKEVMERYARKVT
jgi:cholesterol oxidase